MLTHRVRDDESATAHVTTTSFLPAEAFANLLLDSVWQTGKGGGVEGSEEVVGEREDELRGGKPGKNLVGGESGEALLGSESGEALLGGKPRKHLVGSESGKPLLGSERLEKACDHFVETNEVLWGSLFAKLH